MPHLGATTPGLKPLNHYQFNGKEFQVDLGLNWNHQDWRFFDPQLGRWHATDPELENGQESWTPYSFGFDNALRYADANGRNPGDGWGGFGSSFAAGYVGTFTGIRDAVVSAVDHPGAALAALPGAYASAVALPFTLGYQAAADGFQLAKAAVQGDGAAVGQQLGGAAAQLTVAAVTEGAGRAVGAVAGAVKGAGAAETQQGARFIVAKDGTAMFKSIGEGRASLENAGYRGTPTTNTTETGTTHTLPYQKPNGTQGNYTARLMNGQAGDASGLKGPRVVTTRQAHTKEYVQPNGQDLPKGTPKQDRRELGHTHGLN